ncbi:MAG: GNAT family N-acetyltransferase [Mobilitalea sp.]
MKLREYHPDDCKEVVKLFYDTIHSINIKDYTELQADAWASKNTDLESWNKKLLANYTVVVEKDGIIAGFGDVDSRGYFDYLFTHKDYQGQGIATLIVQEIENYCKSEGFQMITTDASITAKPFFERRGYLIQKAQIVEIKGQLLNNFKMIKHIRKWTGAK